MGFSNDFGTGKDVVILCAGEGHRLMDMGKNMPKALVKINGRALLSYVMEYWRPFASRMIFVVGYKKEQIVSFVEESAAGIRFDFVEQDKPLGIAHAVSCAEKLLGDDFIVVLGDCLCKGRFGFPGHFSQGVGVWRTKTEKYIMQSYSVEISERSAVGRVIEKPKELKNDLCGMGYYFFNKKVFDFIRSTPPSALRSEIEITDVIQKMIDSGERVEPLYFEGDYINLTSCADIELAAQFLG